MQLDVVVQSRLFVFNDTATTEIYTLSLHDALPIALELDAPVRADAVAQPRETDPVVLAVEGELVRLAVRRVVLRLRLNALRRSEEHTSELQSRQYLVCRLLLEKKKSSTSCRAYRYI